MKLVLRKEVGEPLVTIDLGDAPDSNGTMNGGDLGYGELYLEIDGVAYGAVQFSQVVEGQAYIALGQYDPTFDQWAPQNPITDREPDAEGSQCECSDPFTASLTGHGHACPMFDGEA